MPQAISDKLFAAKNYDHAQRPRVRVALAAITVSLLICMAFMVSYVINGDWFLLLAVLFPFFLPLTLLGYLIWKTRRYRYVLIYVFFFFTTMGLFNLLSSPTYLVDVFLIPVISGIAFLVLRVRQALMLVLYLMLLYAVTAVVVYFYEPFPVLYSNDSVTSLVVGFVAALLGSIAIFYFFARAYQESSEALSSSLIALRKANDDNNLLIQVLSHDFKNYLQRMLMDIDAGKRQLTDEKALQGFDGLQSSISQLSDLLDEVQLVRDLAAENESSNNQVPLTLAAKKMEMVFRQQLLQKQLTLGCQDSAGLVLNVNADVFLHIILANLLSNAVKFSPMGSEISIVAGQQGDRGDIRISNQAEPQHRQNLNSIIAGARSVDSQTGTDAETGQGLGSGIVRSFCRRNDIGFAIAAADDASTGRLRVTARLSVPLAGTVQSGVGAE